MHSQTIVVRCFQENNGASGAGFHPVAALLPSRGMRPRSSPVRTWQSLWGRDVSGSSVRAMQPSSDAEKAGAVLSHRACGEVPEPQHSTWAALTGSSKALGHLSPCSFACRSLSPALHWNQFVLSTTLQSSWEPFPSLTPFLPPSVPCWHFPCCHHIPSCFLVDPPLCTWTPFSWLLLPQGGPWGSPTVPLALGFLHLGSTEKAELPPRCF